MKEEKVINYYVLCNKLKDTIRTGWQMWHIKKEHVESVAEHIYGTQMLAIAIYSEYDYDVDLSKVLYMLAVHELEEIVIGDIPLVDPKHNSKKEIGQKAVKRILKSLKMKDEIERLIWEFDERQTKEALFAYHCDKLECDLQAKLYSEQKAITLDNQNDNTEYINARQQLDMKSATFADIWFNSDEYLFSKDQNFKDIFNYARDHQISINEK